MTADLRRSAERRQRFRNFLQTEEFQQFPVIVPGMEIHEVGTRAVRDLRLGFSRQAEADIILALEDPADVPVALRLVVPQPGQQ